MGIFDNDYMYTWGAGPATIQHAPKLTKKEREERDKKDRQNHYFDGLEGLSKWDRADWEKKYAKELEGKDEAYKENLFKNKVFIERFKNSKDPEDQKLWNRREELTVRERDIAVANATLKDYDAEGGPRGKWNHVKAYNQAEDYLRKESDDLAEKYKAQLQSLEGEDRQHVIDTMKKLSEESSAYFKEYYGTDKLQISDDELVDNMAKLQAWSEIGGDSFAVRLLGEQYQDALENNQSAWEVLQNTGAQFIDSVTGMMIRAYGMSLGLMGFMQKEGQSYWASIINNDITRYGDRVVSTNTYDEKDQERLEKLGLSDNQIFETAREQRDVLNLKTPFKLLGQYGFTAASTILSCGGSALVSTALKGASAIGKVISWAGKATGIARGANATAKGVSLLKNLSKAKDIGNWLVTGGIATVEGGMNAAQTKQSVLDSLNADIDARYSQKVQDDIEARVISNPMAAAQALRSAGYDVPLKVSSGNGEKGSDNPYSQEEIENMVQMMQNDEKFTSSAMKQYAKDIEAERAEAESSSDAAMYADFIGNSVINGFLNSTLSAGLHSKSVQNTLKKMGLQKSRVQKRGVDIAFENGKWTAKAKNYTRLKAMMDRGQEALGEGMEEYVQDLSSGFGEAFGKDRFQQYVENKYGGGEAEDAVGWDFWQSFGAGAMGATETAISEEALKDGLYGALSTAMGGLNLSARMLNGTGKGARKEGESFLKYAARKSPIGWRSMAGPLFSNSETQSVNEERNKLAERMNEFFAREESKDAFFSIVGTSNFMKQEEKGAADGDEKEVRDNRLGTMFSNIVTLNHTKGSAYYDAVMASLKARANFDAKNLQDENSVESQAVEQYKSDAINRGQEVSNEEALEAIKSSSSKMLDLIKKVDKATNSIEKIIGEDIDKDVLEGFVFQRIAAQDTKKRRDQLEEELSKVTAAVDKETAGPANEKPVSNSRKVNSLIARFGNINAAENHLNELETAAAEAKAVLKEQKAKRKEAKSPEAKIAEEAANRAVQAQLKKIEKEIARLKHLVKNYHSETDMLETNELTGEERTIPGEVHVVSAQDIMRLSAEDRRAMLLPANRKRYSEEQLAEIDKVNKIGTAVFEDFASKVDDCGRLAYDYQASLNKQMQMLLHPELFSAEVSKIKYKARNRMITKKYEHLLEEDKDYDTFKREYFQARENATQEELPILQRMFHGKNNENYNKLQEELSTTDEIVKTALHDENLSDNEKGLVQAAAAFLFKKGIDITDADAVIAGLQELSYETTNQNGTTRYAIEDLIDKYNAQLDENEKITFQDINHLIDRTLQTINLRDKNKKQIAADNAEIAIGKTSKEDAAPPPRPTPVDRTEEGNNDKTDDTTDDTDTDTKYDNSAVEAFKQNSSKKVAEVANKVLNGIASAPGFDNAARERAQGIVEDLSATHFDSEQEMLDEITRIGNARLQESENDPDPAGYLLKHIASRVSNLAAAGMDIDTRTARQKEADKKSGIDTSQRQVKQAKGVGEEGKYSSAIDSVDIPSARKNYGDKAPIVKYADRYHMEQVVLEGILDDNPPVLFITDEDLNSEVAESMGGRYNPELSMPIVAVVEHPNGPITIDGKQYQPIAIMPGTSANTSRGSAQMELIRRPALKNNQGQQLVTDEDGNPIKTTISGKARSYSVDRNYKGRNEVTAVSREDMTPQEKSALEALDKPARRKQAAYKREKGNFIANLDVVERQGKVDENGIQGEDTQQAVYRQRSTSGDEVTVNVFPLPLNKSTARDSDKTLEEAKKDRTLSNFNSRTKRAVDALTKFVQGFSTEGHVYTTLEGGTVVAGQSEGVLQEAAQKLDKAVSRFLKLPAGWTYKISPVTANGSQMQISLLQTSTEQEIPLIQFQPGTTTNYLQNEEFLSKLIFDAEGKVKMSTPIESFVKWQLDYHEIELAKEGNATAKSNLEDMYDDGCISVAATKLRHAVQKVTFNTPEGKQPIKNPFKSTTQTETANRDNAQIQSAPDNVGKDDVAENGTSHETDEQPVNDQLLREAEAKVEQIVADSKKMTLDNDQSGYVNTETNQRTARVTSIIMADYNAGTKFDDVDVPKNTSPAAQLVSHIQGMGIAVHGKESMIKYLKNHGVKDIEELSGTTEGDVDFLRAGNNEIYGFVTPKGEIFIDEARMSPDVPIHEYTHLWDRMIQQKNPAFWEKGVSLMKQTQLWQQITEDENYGQKWSNLDEKVREMRIASEVHSRLMGDFAKNSISAISRDNKGDTRNIIKQLYNWLQEFWNKVGISLSLSQEQIDKITNLNDFNGYTLRDFVDGLSPVDEWFHEKTNPWTTPATTIGNNVDEFVRDFFSGAFDGLSSSDFQTKLNTELKYKNATAGQWEAFRDQLEALRNKFTREGLHVVPRNVVATGNIEVVDDEGQTHVIPVAGTLDLLAYDDKGNFYIYDMKTFRGDINNEKQEKYARQLSLYKKFLEDKYGINVVQTALIPIKVQYDAPIGWGDGKALYSTDDSGQLYQNDKLFNTAKPTLDPMLVVDPVDINIDFNKLTWEESNMGQIYAPTGSTSTDYNSTDTEVQVDNQNTETTQQEESEKDNTEASSENYQDFDNAHEEDSNLGDFDFMMNPIKRKSSDKKSTEQKPKDVADRRATVVPKNKMWDNLTKEQRKNLEAQKFNKEIWESMEDQEMDHFLKCMG